LASAASRISAHTAVHKPQAANTVTGPDDGSAFSLLLNKATAKPAAWSGAPSQDSTTDGHANADSHGKASANGDRNGDAPNSQTPVQTATTSSPILNQASQADTNTDDEDASAPAAKPKAADSQNGGPAGDPSQTIATPDMTAQSQLALVMPVQAPQAPQPPVNPQAGDADGDSGDDSGGDTDPLAAVTAAANAPKSGPQTAATGSAQQQAGVPQSAMPGIGAPDATPAGATQADASKSDAAKADASQADALANDAGNDIALAAASKPVQAKGAAKPGISATDTAKATKPDDADASPRAQVTDAIAAATPAPQPAQPALQPQASDNNQVTGMSGLVQAAPATASGPASGGIAHHIDVVPQDSTTPTVNLLAVQIAAKSQGGARQFDIRLDPPELGRVDVRLSIDASGKAQAHLSADQQGTLDMLQKDAPVLARALRDAGLDVSQGGLNFSLRGQGGNNAGNNAGSDMGGGQNSRRNSLAALQSIKPIDTATPAVWRSAADGRLDIRV
jgi:flagellar hook-length control protein FliK